MSLKARLRIAVAVLMSAVVIVLSVLYLRGFLANAFTRTHEIAKSIGNQVQASTLEVLRRRTAEAKPANREEAKRFWIETVQTDPTITGILSRALENWQMISEVFIVDSGGRIRASSNLGQLGQIHGPAVNFEEWSNRSLVGNLRQVFWEKENTQLLWPLAVPGETTPVVTIHVVVSSLFLRNDLMPGLEDLGFIFLTSLLVSVILALILPNVVVNPLERLSARLDLMATGKFPAAEPARRRESKEFAAVYSKLNLLGQQFQGARQDAQELRSNVEQLVQRMEQAVLLFDHKGKLLMAGRQVGRILGQDPESLVGRDARQLFPLDTEVGSLIANALEQHESVRDRIIGLGSDGNKGRFLVTIEPLGLDAANRPMGTLITLRDAETRGQLVAQLDLAARLAALSQLTRGVAHEIKNPLNAITLHLEVLRNRLEEESPEVDVIAREISRLDRVVKTFLDFNRPVQPRMGPLDLTELASEICRLVQPEATARRVELTQDLDAAGAWIQGDGDLLKQAILNVVMNGMEAMKEGGELRLRTCRESGRSVIEIVDTGPGIPPEIQDKIFNLYFSTKSRGSGIGLAMAFRFVQLHDGKIEFTTQPGHGTTFRFIFSEAVSQSAQELEISRSQRA